MGWKISWSFNRRFFFISSLFSGNEKKKKLTVYGTVKFGDLSEALGYQLHNVSSCLLFHVLGVSMAGKGEAAKDGAIPADEHFPQAGDRQNAKGTHPSPKHPDRAKTCHWWHHHHEWKSTRRTELHVWCQNSCSVEKSTFNSALILPTHFIVVNSCDWPVKSM